MPSRFPLTAFPAGWFRLAGSDDVPRGHVRPLRCLGRDFVAFRGMDGTARVLDAHCPHLGAHLGIGGRVDGNAIVCPFHRWAFDGGSGRCLAVPYSRSIPKVSLRTWPVREANGQIMVYHALGATAGAAPTWDFPDFQEHTSSQWTSFKRARSWRIRTHVQELGENAIDLPHFSVVHGQQTLEARTNAVRADGPLFVHRIHHVYRVFRLARLFGNRVSGPLEITFYGPGCVVNRALVNARITLEYAVAFFLTPLEEELVEVSPMFAMKKLRSRIVTAALLRKAIREGGVTIDQDVPIWENKIYRAKPVLCDGDGPIHEFRRWARQFYETDEGPGPAKAARMERGEGTRWVGGG